MRPTIGGAADAIAAPRSRRIAQIIAIVAAAALLSAGAAPAMATAGDYTSSQAQAGQHVFMNHCSQCHGSQLQGQAGPPLEGKAFASNLRYSQMTTKQLYHFIKTQMPGNDPGSLKDKQYLDALAFILSQNGYPSGARKLTKQSTGKVKLLPYPGSGKGNTSGKQHQASGAQNSQ